MASLIYFFQVRWPSAPSASIHGISIPRRQEGQELETIGIDELAFDPHRIAAPQSAKIIHVGCSSIVRHRHGNHSAVARPDIKDTQTVINSVYRSLDDIGSRARWCCSAARDTWPAASLNRLLNAYSFNQRAIARRRSIGDTIAGFEIVYAIILAVIDHSRAIGIVAQNIPSTIIGDDPELASGWINLIDLSRYLTRL
jgi:hypothetical protein